MSNTSLLGSYGGLGNSGLQFRNKLINGNFDIWQRGTSQTGTSYGSDDRWNNEHVGSTKTHSRQAFALGQTEVPGNPEYFSRTVVSSVTGDGNHVLKEQRVESVTTFAGQTVTLSFWAKADAPKNMAVEFRQFFGSGGSPSAIVNISPITIALTTTWKYYTVTANIPSISGKVIGADGNDSFFCRFWFDAGSNFNARTNNLGQQSGTFDIAQVQLEAGPVATPFEHRPVGLELQLAQRYYQNFISPSNGVRYSLGYEDNTAYVYPIQLLVPMRATPGAVSVSGSWQFQRNGSGFTSGTGISATTQSPTNIRLLITVSAGTTGGNNMLIANTNATWTAEAEL